MKNIFFKNSLSLLLILVVSFSFAQNSDNIEFEKTTQKFKKVDEGHQITLNYSFTYTGKIPLTILEPEVDCSCTTIVLPEGKIKSNSTNIIKIKFDTNDKIGWQEREVVIQFISDLMDSRFIEKKLIFKGMVKASKATKTIYKKKL
ncbi:MAG: DUF1573 domain-containing protein [Flavobacteriales bacterium]|nr:DUF1573 domain-containing protein [Flavobacteriales bacterium]NQX96307.1 DUF1573 domain-containing protein [Flavobacteriales bacterium]